MKSTTGEPLCVLLTERTFKMKQSQNGKFSQIKLLKTSWIIDNFLIKSSLRNKLFFNSYQYIRGNEKKPEIYL